MSTAVQTAAESTAFPQLRGDLEITAKDTPEGQVHLVRDPRSGRFCQFRQVEHFLARQCDGQSSPDQIRQRVKAEFGVELAAETLERFLGKLSELHLLSTGAEEIPPQPRRRVQGSVLHLRVTLFDPDRLLARLTRPMRFLFTGGFLVASVMLILTAGLIFLTNSWEITAALRDITRWQFVVPLVAAVFAVTMFHEMAHGLTCKFHGGDVHEIGILLMFFLPGLYCDVSSAWQFPEKGKRIWVTLAGRCNRLLGGRPAASSVAPRLRRIFLVYGALAALFSAGLLTFVAFKTGGFLMERFQAFGFLAFVGVLGTLVYRPLTRLAWRPVRRTLFVVAPAVGVLLCPWELSVVGNVEVAAGRKADLRAEVDGMIGEVLTEEGADIAEGDVVVRLYNLEQTAELAQIEAEIQQKQADLELLEAGAKPEEIALAEAEVKTTKTRSEHARQRLTEADQIRAQRLRAAQADVREAETSLQLASANLQRNQSLLASRAITQAEVDRTLAEVQCDRAKLDSAKAQEQMIELDDLSELSERVAVSEKEWRESERRLSLLKSGARSEEIASARAAVQRLEARRTHLQDLIRRTAVATPITGTVTTPRMDELQDRRIARGELIAQVQQLDTVRVELTVSEKELGDVQVGRPVDLKVLAYPNRCFHGKVTAVAPAAVAPEDGNHARDFLVTTMIDNGESLLKPGMTGKAKIRCGKTRVPNIFVRKLSHYVRVEFWSWW